MSSLTAGQRCVGALDPGFLLGRHCIHCQHETLQTVQELTDAAHQEQRSSDSR